MRYRLKGRFWCVRLRKSLCATMGSVPVDTYASPNHVLNGSILVCWRCRKRMYTAMNIIPMHISSLDHKYRHVLKEFQEYNVYRDGPGTCISPWGPSPVERRIRDRLGWSTVMLQTGCGASYTKPWYFSMLLYHAGVTRFLWRDGAWKMEDSQVWCRYVVSVLRNLLFRSFGRQANYCVFLYVSVNMMK